MSCSIQSESESLHTRGNEHYRTSHYSEALSDYSAAINLLESNTTPTSHNLLLSRLYHNRALTKEKLGDGERYDEKAEAQADARRATELDPTYPYVKAWALFARLLEKAPNRDARHVEEALDATHRVMELEVGLCNGDVALGALNTMEKLVRWELERHLKMTPLSYTIGEIDAATAMSKLKTINGEVELNQHLVQCIRTLFKFQGCRNTISRFTFGKQLGIIPNALSVNDYKMEIENDDYKMADTTLYEALSFTFYKMRNIRMSISCAFQWIHLLNQLEQLTQENTDAAKVSALYLLQCLYSARGVRHLQQAGNWIETALQLHNDAESELGIRMRIKSAEVNIFQMEYTRALQELELCVEICKVR